MHGMRDVHRRMMVFKTLCLMVMFISQMGTGASCFAANSFFVIVNSQNSFSADPEQMKVVVSRLFLKKQSAWPSGELVKPYDRSPQSGEHQRFVEEILKIGEGHLLNHWAKIKQLRGETPPRSIKATSILLKLIEKNKGGWVWLVRRLPLSFPMGSRSCLRSRLFFY